jgi:LmbE family N-acetylglucosaminyl deacetylase
MLLTDRGHKVVMVSMTNGDAGHHELSRAALAKRRAREAKAAAKLLRCDYVIMPIADGKLEPTVANREKLIALMRKYDPDVVITHPLQDYHPDHRYTTMLVMDTAYLLQVPSIVPDVKALNKETAFFFSVNKPEPGGINIPVPIDSVWERKLRVWHCHASQMYEWLPWIEKRLAEIPDGEAECLEYLHRWRGKGAGNVTRAFKHELGKTGNAATYCEALTLAPVGRRLSVEQCREIFNFEN